MPVCRYPRYLTYLTYSNLGGEPRWGAALLTAQRPPAPTTLRCNSLSPSHARTTIAFEIRISIADNTRSAADIDVCVITAFCALPYLSYPFALVPGFMPVSLLL